MKKFLTAFLSVIACVAALAFTMSIVACSSSETEKKPAEKKVTTSIKVVPPPGAPPVKALPQAVTGSPPGPVPPSSPPGPDSFVVSVNGVKLTTAEVQNMLKSQMEAISKQVPPKQREKIQQQLNQMKDKWRQQLSDYFIQKTVLAQEADRLKIGVTDAEVDAQFEQYKKQVPPGMKFEDMLKAQGVTMEKLRNDIKNILKAKKLMDAQVKAGPPPTDEEVQKYYADNKAKFNEPEKVKARHILIKSSAKDDEAAKKAKKKKAEDIRKKLLAGGDFAKIAKENSECPTKDKGGDLGTFARGQMVKPFEDAAFSQKINEIGPVVETKFGYHIIQVQEHKKAITKTLDEVKPHIVKILTDKRKQKAIKDYIDSLIKKATIVYGKN